MKLIQRRAYGFRNWLLLKKWGHEVEERPTWPQCV
jgi:hypothetical protein